jgi:hypothetical protein
MATKPLAREANSSITAPSCGVSLPGFRLNAALRWRSTVGTMRPFGPEVERQIGC